MSFSDRQKRLLQGAAGTLINGLQLTHDEALAVIARALKVELARRHTTFEGLNFSSRADRAVFLRGVVKLVQDDLRARKLWRPDRIETVIEEFMAILHESWANE